LSSKFNRLFTLKDDWFPIIFGQQRRNRSHLEAFSLTSEMGPRRPKPTFLTAYLTVNFGSHVFGRSFAVNSVKHLFWFLFLIEAAVPLAVAPARLFDRDVELRVIYACSVNHGVSYACHHRD
jgi:hypothetical protein